MLLIKFNWVKLKRSNIGLPLLDACMFPQLETHFLSGATLTAF